jgi:hypothetical protein
LCVLGTTPEEQHEALLSELLKDERSAYVAHQTLLRAELDRERISQLLANGEEGLRCAIACGLLHLSAEASLYEGALIPEAHATLERLLTDSEDALTRVRAAAGLSRIAPGPVVRETLLACARNPSNPLLDRVYSIYGLSPLARADEQLVADLQDLPSGRNKVAVGLVVAESLMQALRHEEAAESVFGWLDQVSHPRDVTRAMELLRVCALVVPRIGPKLEQLRAEGQSERLRKIAANVCAEVEVRRELRRFRNVPVTDVLAAMEAPTTPELLRLRLSRRLVDMALEDEDSKQAIAVLRGMTVADASPSIRLAAAEALWALAFNIGGMAEVEAETREIIKEVTRSPAEEPVRLRAARLLGEEGRSVIDTLAHTATDEQTRYQAGLASKDLELRAWLQSVGVEDPPESLH